VVIIPLILILMGRCIGDAFDSEAYARRLDRRGTPAGAWRCASTTGTWGHAHDQTDTAAGFARCLMLGQCLVKARQFGRRKEVNTGRFDMLSGQSCRNPTLCHSIVRKGAE
jgi:hypothetical protein